MRQGDVKFGFLGRGPIGERRLSHIRERVSLVVSDEEFIHKFSDTKGCVFISNDDRNEDEILDAITENGINCLISVQHLWILSEDLIDAVDGFSFNLHNAKLPEYKGYNAISHSILNGDPEYVTTIHWIAPDVDSGDIVYEESVAIDDDDTALSLYMKTIPAAEENFKRLVLAIDSGEIPRHRMKDGGIFYGKEEIVGMKEIKCVTDFDEIDRKSRAFYFPPHEPSFFVLGGKKFYVSQKMY